MVLKKCISCDYSFDLSLFLYQMLERNLNIKVILLKIIFS